MMINAMLLVANFMAIGVLLCDLTNGKKRLKKLENNLYIMLINNNSFNFKKEIKLLLGNKKEKEIIEYIKHKTELELTYIKKYIDHVACK